MYTSGSIIKRKKRHLRQKTEAANRIKPQKYEYDAPSLAQLKFKNYVKLLHVLKQKDLGQSSWSKSAATCNSYCVYLLVVEHAKKKN